MAAEDLPPDDPAAAATPAADDDDDDDDLFGTNDDDETPRPISDDGAAAGGTTGPDDGPAPVSARRMLASRPPPPPLPPGWFLRASRSFPSDYYYFNHDTGECRWDHPSGAAVGTAAGVPPSPAVSRASLDATAAAAAAAVKSILKRSGSATSEDGEAPGGGNAHRRKPSPLPRKRAKIAEGSSGERERHRREKERGGGRRPSSSASSGGRPPPSSTSSSGGEPREVRVLHILKKHRGSRRPASWRSPKITDSKEKAVADLRELISILESAGGGSDHKELRATFEELARTESDCSSAKRGGDLGFFGRKKMQPAFERASFGLKVGHLSDIVDTSSGVHVILRIA